VEVVREGIRAFNAGNSIGVIGRITEDAVMRHPPGWPEPGPSVGHDEIARQLARLREDWARYGITEQGITERDDRCVVRLRFEGEGAVSGLPGVMDLSAAYRFRGGRIAEVGFYFDHAEALDAVGLAE
jgi:ketosteroid isomerase-like protein